MSDSFVQVAPDSSGKKIQTFEGTVSAETVEAQSVVLVDETLSPYQPLTDDELRATPVPVDGSGVTQPISAAALPLPSGAASEATLGGVLTTSDFDSKTGALTETAPATDTASSGLNGRLQRIAQRISSLITALGSPFQAGGAIGGSSVAIPVTDNSGSLTVDPGIVSSTGTVITSANGTLNATFNLVSNSGAKFVLVQLDQTTTITAGAISFEITYDDINWITIIESKAPATWGDITLPYTLQANTNKTFQLNMMGARALRLRMTTGMTGTGSITPYITQQFNDLYTCSSSIGIGAVSENTQRVVLANDQPVIPVSDNGGNLSIDDGGNSLTVDGTVASKYYFGFYNTFAAINPALNATTSFSTPYEGGGAYYVALTQTSPITAGAVTFEVNYDPNFGVYSTIDPSQVVDPQTNVPIPLPYTCQANTLKVFRFNIPGAFGLRLKVTSAITGGGTVTPVATEPHGVTSQYFPVNSTTGVLKVQEIRPATPAQSSVANSASSVSLLASNANRLGATIFNDDTANTGATLKVKLGATASATSFTVALAPQAYYEVPFGYTGAIDGIASAATGNARITELTA